MKALTLTLVIAGLFLYVVIGGCIFHALESSAEDDARLIGITYKQKFIGKQIFT